MVVAWLHRGIFGQDTDCFKVLRREGFDIVSINVASTATRGKIHKILAGICRLQTQYSIENTPEMEERRRLLTDEFVPWIRESIGDFLKTLDLQVDSTTGGVGGQPKVVWVRIYDRNMAPSSQSGLYLVYLFSQDGKRIYLSLNQGTDSSGGA